MAEKYKKLIEFPEVVYRKVKDIQEREGSSTFTAAVLSTISQYYDKKYFSKHKGVVSRTEVEQGFLTPEQACEKKGGRVTVREGIPMCALPHGTMTRLVPLSMPEKF